MPESRKFRFRFSDLVLFIYVLAVIRAFFWGVTDESFAWVLTVGLSIALIVVHSGFRDDHNSEVDHLRFRLTLLTFATPVILVFLLRAAFPDQNFDVLNYHLSNMERGLRGFPFIPGDFFPTTVQVNPAADMVFGICKYLLGFRLGHIINLAAVLWTMSVIERFLRGSIRNRNLRYLTALVVVSTELILFLQSIYLVDLLALPLLAEAAVLAVDFKNLQAKKYSLIQIGAFLGISLAFKLSNVAFVIPIGAMAVYQAYRYRKELSHSAFMLGIAAAVIAPIAPFMIFMAHETGSPVFPYYNWLFRSPYTTFEKIVDPQHGPKSLIEFFLWPFWVYIYPERGSEFMGGDNPYTGRIALGFLFAIASLITPRLSEKARLLGIMTAAGVVLWSMSSGNLRYALPMEIIGGMVTFAVLASFFDRWNEILDKRERRRLGLLAACFSVLIGMQVIRSYKEVLTLSRQTYTDKIQPTFFQDRAGYINEAAWIFTDRANFNFLSEDQKATIDSVEVWVNSYPTTVGLMASLKPEIPIISVTPFQTSSESFEALKTPSAILRFDTAKRMAAGRRIYTIVYSSRLNEALINIAKGGFQPKHTETWLLPYFSQVTRLDVQVIELEQIATSHRGRNDRDPWSEETSGSLR